jgi:hypothetical protein
VSEPRILLHVGAPKTGTSFVQDILFTHRDTLRERGVLYPADRHDAHFLAALDLMELPWGGLEREATGRWDRLAAEAREWPGTVIISHEILGRASRLQAARALDSLGADGREVHVVYSARDLVRQIPAEWQENVKHRRTKTYGEFLANLRDPARSAEVAQWFWGVQEAPDVLDRWASTVPRERVHLVTVPPAGSSSTLLWERFAGLFGIDPDEFTPTERANPSLGVAESTTVRRLNTRLNNVLDGYGYRRFVREIVVHQHLSHRDSARLSLPPDAHDWASALSRSWVSELALRGYDVIGDLDDLIPATEPRPFVDPDTVAEGEVAEVALDALAVMTIEAARLRQVEKDLHVVIEDLMGQLDAAHATRTYKLKERLVRMSRRNVVVRAAYGGYRRLRGRSSGPT